MKRGTRPHCELCEKERERQVYFRTHVPSFKSNCEDNRAAFRGPKRKSSGNSLCLAKQIPKQSGTGCTAVKRWAGWGGAKISPLVTPKLPGDYLYLLLKTAGNKSDNEDASKEKKRRYKNTVLKSILSPRFLSFPSKHTENRTHCPQ